MHLIIGLILFLGCAWVIIMMLAAAVGMAGAIIVAFMELLCALPAFLRDLLLSIYDICKALAIGIYKISRGTHKYTMIFHGKYLYYKKLRKEKKLCRQNPTENPEDSKPPST